MTLTVRSCVGRRAFWKHSKVERSPFLPTSLTFSLLDLLHPLGRVTLRCAHRKLWELERHVWERQGSVQDSGRSLVCSFPIVCLWVNYITVLSFSHLSSGGDNSLSFFTVCVCNLCKSSLKTRKAYGFHLQCRLECRG